MAWTDEMVEDLKKMWKEGLTTGEIGKRLNVSKNSIVGKVHRLGLSGRPSPIKKKDDEPVAPKAPKAKPAKAKAESKPAEKKALSPAKETAVTSKPAETVAEEKKKAVSFHPMPAKEGVHRNGHHHHNLSLTELDNHTCRWPVGDPKDANFHFCGKKVRLGQTYCEEHSSVAYVKPGKK